MKTTRRLLLAALAFAGGCTPAPQPSTSPPRAACEPASSCESPPEGLLMLAELRVFARDEPFVTLYRNGLLVQRGEVLGTLHSDGTFVDLGGTLHITMNADGTVPISAGTLVLDEAGVATIRTPDRPPQRMHFDAAGHIVGTERDFRVEGMTPATRRTAMFVFLLPDLLLDARPPRIQ
ncbi:hypothetical protein [Polyangium mundeleinium]|uniref:Uncharacterized protein n=1 Tax=Polyangium mundeleinium TaxID=2995306 RepID=A0ABT5EF73_9BACT|nr:hypothetical protein [Polyangium mundeleinium]MDC0740032.1 hypothetical protein [Polyangium mundeleinium]